MPWHKSNVDFRRGDLHNGRAIRSAHHTGRDLQGCSSFFPVFHVQAQVQVGWNHAAEQGRAAAHANMSSSGHVSRNFQQGRHGSEFQWNLKADLGVRLCRVGCPQEE